jgi:RsiW-degrading membrane proteinase PrsW (M82 family)
MVLLSLALAFLPSLIWLGLFLREDVHPEPNPAIRRVFIAGMLVTIPTILIEGFFSCLIRNIGCPTGAAVADAVSLIRAPLTELHPTATELVYLFIGIGLVEEVMKYLAVRQTILRKRIFNEPIDAVLYLVIAALGFAAVENALIVTNTDIQAASLFGAGGVVEILGARSLSAVLLHILASGIIGFGLARSFFSSRPHHLFLGVSILIAAIIHGMYDGVVGGLVWEGAVGPTIASTVALLVLTGLTLLGMMQYLRSLSSRTVWENTGDDVAHEISSTNK